MENLVLGACPLPGFFLGLGPRGDGGSSFLGIEDSLMTFSAKFENIVFCLSLARRGISYTFCGINVIKQRPFPRVPEFA